MVGGWDIAMTKNYYEKQIDKCKHRVHRNIIQKEIACIRSELIEEHPSCQICGYNFKPILHIHHIVPLKMYGDNSRDNLIVVCPNCHKLLHKAYSAVMKDRFLEYIKVFHFVHNLGCEDRFYPIVSKFIDGACADTSKAEKRIEELITKL